LSFFSNYLISRKTQYIWNNFISSLFGINIGIGQGFALSPILSALYISPIFHIFEKRAKNLIPNIYVSFLSSIDNGLLSHKRKPLKNQILYSTIVIISLSLSSISLVSLSNMGNQKFSII